METTTKDKGPGTDVFSDKQEPASLADAAQQAMADVLEGGATQDVLDDTDYTKVKFVGMSFDSLDKDVKIGDEKTFIVRARCIGTADEASKRDGSIRHVVKMDVQSVVLQ